VKPSAIPSALMKMGISLLLAVCALGQEIAKPPDVPKNFKLDFEAAAKMRPVGSVAEADTSAIIRASFYRNNCSDLVISFRKSYSA